ncbi:NAD(P)H-dependent oxidoreductase [Erysipelotrichaceae bacterium RD49]|nr:NAD(P)H-dependent oxidoreductase [Erysipelotrichaceae bacterium RD49]
MKILLVSGSLREKSFNTQLMHMAQNALADLAEVRILDWSDLPLFNQDDEKPVLPAVDKCRDAFLWADGVWFFTPEYNQMIPGPLKNMLDWMSRPLDPAAGIRSALTGRYAAISGAAGRMAAQSARSLLARLLTFCQMKVYDEQVGVGATPAEMKTSEFSDPQAIQKDIDHQAKGFVDWIQAQQAA